VGYARLYSLPALSQRLENGFTGVRRSHRRRGIATALKRAQVSWAAANGYRELVTSTVEGNDAMRGVNARLGYRPLPAWIVVQGATP
jgi:RimJ/RimL family protein N-acetyltransferase